ncbi:MAG: adenosine-specific kinase [Acidobacteria bacterium]|nr:adenosine-specific kinase [Acidobacteriota bacterium]
MELSAVRIEIPEGANVIIGHSHFIKTVEDLYEAIVGTVPGAKFGLAFNEASGPCLVRAEGNDDELRAAAIRNAQAVGAGHLFVVLLRNAFPINLLHRIREVPEVCNIFCATANPVELIVAQGAEGRGVLGVIDGSTPKGVEGPGDVAARKALLRKFGYKL